MTACGDVGTEHVVQAVIKRANIAGGRQSAWMRSADQALKRSGTDRLEAGVSLCGSGEDVLLFAVLSFGLSAGLAREGLRFQI